MPRTSPHTRPINPTSADWLTRLNENFAECLEEPFPMAIYANTGLLPDARLFESCLVLVGASGSVRKYFSDGTTWLPYTETLTFIDDLVPGVATIVDIQTAYNDLLADMQSKGWML